MTARPRVTCSCGKTCAQRLDGHPFAHTTPAGGWCDPAKRRPLTPVELAQVALAATSTADLLRKAYEITHRVHAAEVLHDTADNVADVDTARERLADLRPSRALIDVEILTRTGGR